jgi:hypothetical protein
MNMGVLSRRNLFGGASNHLAVFDHRLAACDGYDRALVAVRNIFHELDRANVGTRNGYWIALRAGIDQSRYVIFRMQQDCARHFFSHAL